MAEMNVDVIIRLTDELSGPAKAAAAALKEMANAAKGLAKSTGLDKLPNQLRALQESLSGPSNALAKLKTEMSEVGAAAKQMSSAMSSRQSAGWINNQVEGLKKIKQHQKEAIANATLIASGGGGRASMAALAAGAPLGGVASMVAGGAALGGLWKLAQEGGKLSHASVNLEKLGLSPADLADIRKQAVGLAGSIAGTTPAGLLESFGAGYSMFGFENMKRLLPTFAAFQQSAHLNPESSAAMLRSGELMGAFTDAKTHMVDVEAAQRFFSVANKAMLAGHGLISPESILSLAKQGGPALMHMNENGLLTSMILTQALGGGRAGTALMSTFQQLGGGVMFTRSAQELQRLGLLKQNEWSTDRGGRVSVKDDAKSRLWSMFGEDPLKAINQQILPAMVAKGITKTDDQIRELMTLFGRSTTQRMAAELIRNAKQNEAEVERIKQALGIDTARMVANSKDFETAVGNVTASFRSLAQVAGDQPGIVKGLDGISNGVRQMALLANTHPNVTAGAFWGTAGIASAAALGGGLRVLAWSLRPIAGAAQAAVGPILGLARGLALITATPVGAITGTLAAVAALIEMLHRLTLPDSGKTMEQRAEDGGVSGPGGGGMKNYRRNIRNAMNERFGAAVASNTGRLCLWARICRSALLLRRSPPRLTSRACPTTSRVSSRTSRFRTFRRRSASTSIHIWAP
jgi:hypothetical protein